MKDGILRSESTNKAIIFSSILSLLAKLFTFVQSMIISYAFGIQKSTDILFYAVSFVVLFTSLVCSINQQVIVPTAINIREKVSEEDSKSFISFIFFIYLLIGAAVTVLMLFSSVKAFALFSRFDIDDIQENINIIRFIIMNFTLILLNTYILDVFTSFRYFTLPMMLDMVKNVVIILLVILLKNSFSVLSLAIGIFAGNLIQFAILIVLMKVVLKCKFSLKTYKIDSLVKRNILFVVLGQITTFIYNFAVMYLISAFDTGTYTAMSYSRKITDMVSTVIIGQLSVVIGMNIIELYARKDFNRLNELFLKYLKLSLFLVLPLCFVLSFNSREIISIVFERGKFSSDAVKLTAVFFKYFILIIPFLLVDSLIGRLIIAKQIQKVSFLMQAFGSFMSVVLIWVMVKALGVYGYTIGLLISEAVYFFLNTNIMIKTQFKFINSFLIMKFFIFNYGLNLIITGFLFLTAEWFNAQQIFLEDTILLLIFSTAYFSLYIIASYFSRQNRDLLIKTSACLKIAAINKFVFLKKAFVRLSG